MNNLPTTIDTGLMQSLEQFNKTLQTPPDPKTLQKTPDGKAEYLPIDFVENQLREDFGGLVQFIIVSERRELNEYIVVARIKIFHPIARTWMEYDGIGAAQIMQDSGASISQFNETKKKNALEMNAPKAYSEAIKNAAKKIGKKYGGSINRKFEDGYEAIYTTAEVSATAIEELRKCKTKAEASEVLGKYPDLKDNKEFRKVANSIYSQLV
jgi:ribosomal protein S17E